VYGGGEKIDEILGGGCQDEKNCGHRGGEPGIARKRGAESSLQVPQTSPVHADARKISVWDVLFEGGSRAGNPSIGLEWR